MNSAFAGAIFTSMQSPDAIYAWYRAWLPSHGWSPFQPLRSGTQRSIQGYQRGTRERFNVAMDDPAALARVIGQALPPGVTVLEVRYFIFRS